jgi:hypothetical protein
VVASGEAQETADWDARPSSATDGDVLLYTPTNVVYIWSDSFGDWVRDFLYGYTGVLDTEVDGSSATLPTGWSETLGASASISSDGTWLTFDDTGGADSEHAYWQFSHGEVGAEHLVAGYARVDTVQTDTTINPAFMMSIWDNTRNYIVSFNKNSSTDKIIFTPGNPTTEIGTVYESFTGTPARYFEFIVLGINVWLYIDHSPTPTIYSAQSAFASNSDQIYRMGCNTGADKAVGSFRDLKFWRFS